MQESPSVFLSFSSEDRALARRLYDDLQGAGARVFQFEVSARPGSEAWTQVLDSIGSADYFVALLSAAALRSRPVEAEIRYAFYRWVNDAKPILIPAMVEPVEPPPELVTFTTLPFDDYQRGLARLRDTVGVRATQSGGQPRVERRASVRGAQRPRRSPLLNLARGEQPFDSPSLRLNDSTFRRALARSELGAQPSESLWTVGSLRSRLAAIAAAGGAGLVVAIFAGAIMNGNADSISAAWSLPAAVEARADAWPWLRWVSGLGVLLAVLVAILFTVDSAVPIDVADYLGTSVLAQLVALVAGSGWAALFVLNSGSLSIIIPALASTIATLVVTAEAITDDL